MKYKNIIFLLLGASVVLNGFFLKEHFFSSRDTKVRFDYHSKSDDFKFFKTFIEKDKKVFAKLETEENGKPGILVNILELDDCVVIDSKNWSCGGKYEFIGTKTKENERYSLNQGKFFYRDGISFVLSDYEVKYEQLN